MLNFEEKMICRKVGHIFELADADYRSVPFAKCWLKSKNVVRLMNYDFNDVAQSPLYLFELFIEENDLSRIKKNPYQMADVMFWYGYILTWIIYDDKIQPSELEGKYDITSIFESYETLHTTSNEYAVDLIRNEYKLQ